MGVSILPVSDVPWGDVQVVFGTRGDPAHCWCQFFKVTNQEWNTGSDEDKQRSLCGQVPTVSGLVAYLDDEPVGWCAVEPRTRYPRILTSKVIAGSAEPHEDDGVWAVTCFVVRVGFRRRGVAGALLASAVEHARTAGARVIEGYPVDTAETRASAADLYHGSLSLFEKAGFRVIARPAPGRAVVAL